MTEPEYDISPGVFMTVEQPNHILQRKPPGGGGGHTPGVGWMCTGCDWRFSYDVDLTRARKVWLDDIRHMTDQPLP